MQRSRLVLAALSAGLVASLVACGGDSDASSTTTTSTTVAGDDQSPPTTNPSTPTSTSPTETSGPAPSAAPGSDRPTFDLVVFDDESVDHNPVELAVGGELSVRNGGQEQLTCTFEGDALPPLAVSSAYSDPDYQDGSVTFDEAGTYNLTCDLATPVTLTVVVA